MKKYLGFVAVSVFLLSCTNTDRDNPNDERASNYIGKSSAEGLSSSVETDDYPSSSSEENLPSSSSVGPSSSSAEPSSSSGAESSSSGESLPSSSSAEPSSSSAPSSSSSVAPSSSSVAPSSSSASPSSSSTAPSSSSFSGLCAGFVEGTKRLHYGQEKEQFCDERDGNKYVYVKIGEQTWIAEDLNYYANGSKCYGNINGGDNQSNCGTYGRLYEWATAMNNSASSTANPSKVQGVCPAGWHIPSEAEWKPLSMISPLKANSGWNNYEGKSGNGTDNYGFSALPGGIGNSNGYFTDVGEFGYWWSASEYYGNSSDAGYRRIGTSAGGMTGLLYGNKSNLFSVRCVRD